MKVHFALFVAIIASAQNAQPYELKTCCAYEGNTNCTDKDCWEDPKFQANETACILSNGTFLNTSVTCEIGWQNIENITKPKPEPEPYEVEGCCVFGGATQCSPWSRCWDSSEMQTSEEACKKVSGTYLHEKVTCENGLENVDPADIPMPEPTTADGGTRPVGCCCFVPVCMYCADWQVKNNKEGWDKCQATEEGCNECTFGRWMSEESSGNVNAKIETSLVFASIGLAAWWFTFA